MACDTTYDRFSPAKNNAKNNGYQPFVPVFILIDLEQKKYSVNVKDLKTNRTDRHLKKC